MKRIGVIIVVAVVVGAVAYVIGMQMGKKKAMKAMDAAANGGDPDETGETTT